MSSGIEPVFALAYERNVMEGHPPDRGATRCSRAVARHEGFYSEELMAEVLRSGTLEGLEVPQWVREVFRTSHDITPDWHVAVQANAQRHVDNAVSKTVNFPQTATPEDFGRAYMAAYEGNCKGITCYRDGSKENQVLSTGATEREEDGQQAAGRSPNGNHPVVPKDRPQTIRGGDRTGEDRPREHVHHDQLRRTGQALRGVRQPREGRGLRLRADRGDQQAGLAVPALRDRPRN